MTQSTEPAHHIEQPGTLGRAFTSLEGRLFAPIDIASLVFFRIAFGGLMLWEIWRYFDHDWIARYYIEPEFFFTYYGFGWVQPWPGDWMYVHFYALAGLALLIVLGLWYRVSMTLFFLGFTYVTLLDQTQYLNHFYLVSLLSFLMIFVPAHRAFSLDAARNPAMRSDTAPAWALWILRTQIAVVYFYAGLAKLNGDWLHGEPMRTWLAERTDFWLIGRWFTEEWMVYVFTYGGLLLDLLVVPLLLWKPTRWFALAAAITFHVLNSQLFPIGIFPWLAIAATLLFLPPEWPRLVLSGKRLPQLRTADARGTTGRSQVPRNAVLGLLGVYLAIQLLVPLRHHLYDGNVLWTEEGFRFSWHVRIREKTAEARFFATDPMSGETWEVFPEDYLHNRQEREMSIHSDMVLQFSHYLADQLREEGYEEIEVRANVMSSLNAREPQRQIDPEVDLASQSRNLNEASWILPLE